MIHMDVGNQFICSPNATLLVVIEKSRNKSGISRLMTAGVKIHALDSKDEKMVKALFKKYRIAAVLQILTISPVLCHVLKCEHGECCVTLAAKKKALPKRKPRFLIFPLWGQS